MHDLIPVVAHGEVYGQDERSVRVIACPSPMRMERTEHFFAPGLTLEEILEQVQPRAELRRACHCFIDDHLIPRDRLRVIRPKPGTTVTIRVVPMGGGNKILRTLLFAVVAIAAAAASFFTGGIAGVLVGALISTVGGFLINTFIPPPQPKLRNLSTDNSSPTLSISGARNQMLLYGIVPRVYGKFRVTPPYGARPYTELVGKDQWLRLLFDLGYGPLELSELRIGETSVDNFDGVEYEIRQGYTDDAPLSLYTRSVFEESLAVLLDEDSGTSPKVPNWTIKTTQPNADEVSVDVTFLQGLTVFNADGSRSARTVELAIEYSVAGADDWKTATSPQAVAAQTTQILARPSGINTATGAPVQNRTYKIALDPVTGVVKVVWGNSAIAAANTNIMIASVDVPRNAALPRVLTDVRPIEFTGVSPELFVPTLNLDGSVTVAAGVISPSSFIVTDNSTTAVRAGRAFKVPQGQYDIRMRRVTLDSNDDKIMDKVTWTAIRTIRNTPPTLDAGHCLVAMRIKATDELNGIVDEFNCVAESILVDWDGAQWIEQPTSNPAAIDLDILRGTANGFPTIDADMFDWPAYEAWAEDNVAHGREFNAVIDFETTVFQARQMVCATGRARPTLRDGKFSVVQDKPDETPVQHFTPRNSWGFRGTKAFIDLPHALRIPFVNRDNDWRPDERIVYADGYDSSNATRFEQVDMFGVTDPEQVWKDGRYNIAVMELRPETYELNADFEHIVAALGDVVMLTHDVLAVGIGSGRIKQVLVSGETVTAIVTDEQWQMTSGPSYGVSIRTVGNVRVTAQVVNSGAQTHTLTFTTPLPFVGSPAESPVSVGDLLAFGELGSESMACLVKSIEPAKEFEAKLVLVPASPAVHDAESGTIPPFDPMVTPLPRVPLPPTVIAVDSGDLALVLAKDGTVQSRIAVVLAPPGGLVPVVRYQGEFRRASSNEFWIAVPDGTVQGGLISFMPVEDGGVYDMRVRSVGSTLRTSEWVYILAHTVIGKTNAPPAPNSFTVSRLADGTRRFVWTLDPVPADVRVGGGFEIRYTTAPPSPPDWDTMSVLPPGFMVGYSLETNELAAGTYQFAIKTKDSSGNYSEAARWIDGVVLDDPQLGDAIFQDFEHERGWPGTKTDCFVDTDNVLRAVSVGGWDDLPATWDALEAEWDDILPRASPITYETEVFDLGDDVSFTPAVTLSAFGTAVTEMSTGTSGDGTAVTPYAALAKVNGVRYIKFRVTVTDDSSDQAPALASMGILLNAPITEFDLEDIDTAGIDTAEFASLGVGHFLIHSDGLNTITRASIVAFQNAGSGWTWELISKNSTVVSPLPLGSPAAEFKTYHNGTLADAVIDVVLKGIA